MPAIVGSGITGTVLASEFAERGYKAHVYEAAPKCGGMAQAGAYPFTLESEYTKELFLRKYDFQRRNGSLYLSCSWHDWCLSFLEHPNILLMRVAPVYRIPLFSGYYDGDVIYNTVRPDILCNFCFGELPTHGGIAIRTETSVALHAKYVDYLRRYNVTCIGMSATYRYMTIEECAVAAHAEVERVCGRSSDSFLLDGGGHDLTRQKTMHTVEAVWGNGHVKNIRVG